MNPIRDRSTKRAILHQSLVQIGDKKISAGKRICSDSDSGSTAQAASISRRDAIDQIDISLLQRQHHVRRTVVQTLEDLGRPTALVPVVLIVGQENGLGRRCMISAACRLPCADPPLYLMAHPAAATSAGSGVPAAGALLDSARSGPTGAAGATSAGKVAGPRRRGSRRIERSPRRWAGKLARAPAKRPARLHRRLICQVETSNRHRSLRSFQFQQRSAHQAIRSACRPVVVIVQRRSTDPRHAHSDARILLEDFLSELAGAPVTGHTRSARSIASSAAR